MEKDMTKNAHALERLVFFSDAVFAIVITLLVIEIERPELHDGATNADWINSLLALIPSFAGFLLSFMVIGAFWMNHHALFLLVDRYDERLLWPNLILLLSIASCRSRPRSCLPARCRRSRMPSTRGRFSSLA